MKNKLKLLFVGILSLVLATGCAMKTNIHMDIKANKDVTISMTMAMDNELIDAMINSSDGNSGDNETSSNITDKQRWEYVEKSLNESDDKGDWTKTKYDKDGYKGYTYTSKTLKLDDLTGKSDDKFDFFGDEELDKAKIFTKNGSVYKSNFSGDMKKDSSLGSSSSYSSSMDLFEVTFSVSLPNKPSKHNATSVSKDGKTLTWDLTKESDIQFEFSMGPNYLLYGGIAVLVVVVVAVAVIISKGLGKKKNNPNEEKGPDKTEDTPVATIDGQNEKVEPTKEEPAIGEVKENFEPKVEDNQEVKVENSLEAMYNDSPAEPEKVEEPQEPVVEGSLQDMYNNNNNNHVNDNSTEPVENKEETI